MRSWGTWARVALSLGIAANVILFWSDFSDWANSNQGAAAWVQAVGTIFAVFVSGWLAQNAFNRQEKNRITRQAAATTAVIERALNSVADVERGLIHQASGMAERDPLRVLDAVLEALTPMRIHELPNPQVVGLAIDIKAEIADLVSWISSHDAALEMTESGLLRAPVTLLAKIERTKLHCEFFIRYAEQARWR